MEKDKVNTDDHHCSVIEKNRIGAEIAACDESSQNDAEREACHKSVKETSAKREQACKYS